MTVFSGKQVVPMDYEAEVSQRLLEAILDGDFKTVSECVSDPLVDVNFVGAVSLKTRRIEVVLRDESPSEVRVEYEEFKTDVTRLKPGKKTLDLDWSSLMDILRHNSSKGSLFVCSDN